MKILYLSAGVPSSSGTGGRHAVYRHLCELLDAGHDVELVAVDGDRCGEGLPPRLSAIPHAIFPPRSSGGSPAARAFRALTAWLWDTRPWTIGMTRTRASVAHVRARLAARSWDVVVADHLRAFGLVDDAAVSAPIVYLAQNVESRLMRDELELCAPGTARHWFTARSLGQLRRYEDAALRRASRVVAISKADADEFARDRQLARTVIACPELPDRKPDRWRYAGTRRLLFVGSARHFPNVDAMRWLIFELMPRLRRRDPSIRLCIVGTTRSQAGIPDADDQAEFLGFVPESELTRAHLESDLFVCPVTLGSGVKIKVLEAAAWGMPVVLTPESLAGLEFLDGVAKVAVRDDAETFAETVLALLNDPSGLDAMHRATLARTEEARAARRPLEEILREVVG